MKKQIIKQKEFKTLEEFIHGSNNFHLYFTTNGFISNAHRHQACFRRFQKAHSKMERDLTSAVKETYNELSPNDKPLPYKKLWQAYKVMSKLVYKGDKYTKIDGEYDDWKLCR